MTHILTEAAWWIIMTAYNAAAWFKLSCMIAALWAAFDWECRI